MSQTSAKSTNAVESTNLTKTTSVHIRPKALLHDAQTKEYHHPDGTNSGPPRLRVVHEVSVATAHH
eukprot:2379062-Amphidinium_carterae.1